MDAEEIKKEAKEALYWKSINDKIVQCTLCPNFCVLKPDEYGKCKARQNINGKLYTLVYAKPCSIALDPIEKKPLYHFLPGNEALSIATAGCNLHCKHCQNWEISQAFVWQVPFEKVSPESIVEHAKQAGVKIISYTYTEPTIFYEYMLDIAKIAKKEKIKNVMVTNAYINPEPLKELLKYMDAANIDLKSMKPEFYEQICDARLQPILEAIKIMHKKIWIEITNLIIPTLNDSDEDINSIIQFVKSLNKDVPLHFTAFWPAYKLEHLPPTEESTLLKAREKAIEQGLRYVYAGNIHNIETNTTYCWKCGKPVIRRIGFMVIENALKKGKCSYCNATIAGVWD